MSSALAIAKRQAAVAGVRDEIGRSLQVVAAWMPSTGVPSGGMSHLLQLADAYLQLLTHVAVSKGSLVWRCKWAQQTLLNSQQARVCAILRSFAEPGKPTSLAELFSKAEMLSVWKPLKERVTVRLEPKSKGGHRPICSFGPMRKAQCLILRDMLSVLGVDSGIDFTRRGERGEKGLIENVCHEIENGFEWWWTPDVKSYFSSIRPGHFGWIPIDRRLISNIAFIPKCAKIVIIGCPNYDDPSVDCSQSDEQASTLQMVRRGLPQGSVLSPLLARALMCHRLTACLPEMDVKKFTFMDDLFLGARTKKELESARHSVTKDLSSLLAGPIELHGVPIRPAKSQLVDVLGYMLQPNRGHGANSIHVKPGPKKIRRHKKTLLGKLVEAGPDADWDEIGKIYWRQWYGSLGAWTKVPNYTKRLSQQITLTYVDDYRQGLPMGCGVIYNLTKPV